MINRYNGGEYKFLNNYLRSGEVSGFSERELKSWAYCLHSSLQFITSNIPNGTIVYRRVKNSFPSNWRRGLFFILLNLFQLLFIRIVIFWEQFNRNKNY